MPAVYFLLTCKPQKLYEGAIAINNPLISRFGLYITWLQPAGSITYTNIDSIDSNEGGYWEE